MLLLLSLSNVVPECTTMKAPAVKGVHWYMDKPHDSAFYVIRSEIAARVDSVQISYVCNADTTRSHIMRSSNQVFRHTYTSNCGELTKMIVNPFIGEPYEEYLFIKEMLSLPDSL